MAQTVVPPTVTVQRTAPQLVTFAGSPVNFQNLVNGLAQGTTVQLSTVLPDGSSQLVTFTPAGAMSPAQIAQTLEAARQRLIGLGIANPTAEQLAVTLMGGVVPTQLGGSQVPGLVNPQNPPSAAAQTQPGATAGSSAATGATGLGSSTTSTTPPANVTGTINPPVSVQIFPGTTTTATGTAALPRVNTSDSAIPAGATSRSPTLPTPGLPGPADNLNPASPEASASFAAPRAATPPAATPSATAPPAKPSTTAPAATPSAPPAQSAPATPLRTR
jgi:hypothetical protein